MRGRRASGHDLDRDLRPPGRHDRRQAEATRIAIAAADSALAAARTRFSLACLRGAADAELLIRRALDQLDAARAALRTAQEET